MPRRQSLTRRAVCSFLALCAWLVFSFVAIHTLAQAIHLAGTGLTYHWGDTLWCFVLGVGWFLWWRFK